MPNFILSAMQAADLEQVMEVQRLSFTPDLLESESVMRQRFLRLGADFLVLREGGNLAGYALCFPWKLGEIPAHDAPFPDELPTPDSFFLQDISLHPDYRGCGASKVLLQGVFEQAVKRFLPRVSLVAVAQSGTYWDKQGFSPLTNQTAGVLAYLRENYGEGARLMLRDV